MKCSHPYVKRLGADLLCLECDQIVEKQIKEYDRSELKMPPEIYGIDEKLWSQMRPWPLMPFEIVKKHKWYITYLYGRQYLVMPVFKQGKAVFYSARCLEKCDKRFKYSYPENREKVMWQSGRLGKIVLAGEGVADAAYMSQLAPSVAFLGSYGELNRPCIVVMDGDIKGIEAAFKIVQALRKNKIVGANAVMLPVGKDPTDIPLDKLRKIIFKQTGVQL